VGRLFDDVVNVDAEVVDETVESTLADAIQPAAEPEAV